MAMDLTADELSLLEIIAQKTSMHTYAILDQVRQMAALTGAPFDKDKVMLDLKNLYDKGLIDYLDKLESWKITVEGRSYL